jgi:methylmalonyl-CoA mutase
LLGDRIRMNAISPWQQGSRVFMRSLATREFGSEISAALPDVIAAAKCAGFDLVIVETSGIGQGDAAIVPHVDIPLYVMTPEFGAASQLEKIDMLDFAEFVAINKFDRKGAADALRDVAKQVQRNKEAWGTPTEQMPVFGTMAAHFNDDGVTALFQAMKPRLQACGLKLQAGRLPTVNVRHSSHHRQTIRTARELHERFGVTDPLVFKNARLAATDVTNLGIMNRERFLSLSNVLSACCRMPGHSLRVGDLFHVAVISLSKHQL